MWNQLVTSHSNKSYAVTTAELNHAEYEEENWEGKTVYEIEYKENDIEYEYFYLADGSLLQKGEEIKPASLPAAVMEAVKKAHPNAVIKEAKKKMLLDGTVLRFEVELKVGGKELELEIDPDGKILKTEED